MLEHLRNKLLPICGSSRHYEFIINIDFCRDRRNAAATNIIESLLQMPQIVACSNVSIEVLTYQFGVRLPVEAIAKWLNQTSVDPTGVNGKTNAKKQEKFLAIYLNAKPIQNELELVGRLTEVYYLFYRK